MTDDGGAGASKARKKLARHLADHGYLVDSSRPGRPPADDDFLDLIRDLDLGARSPGSRRAFVIFEWARSEYTIAIPVSVIRELKAGAKRAHHLFFATSNAGQNHFYLACNEEGELVVHRRMPWGNRIQTFETEIVS
jgi:hypothetical protein